MNFKLNNDTEIHYLFSNPNFNDSFYHVCAVPSILKLDSKHNYDFTLVNLKKRFVAPIVNGERHSISGLKECLSMGIVIIFVVIFTWMIL